MAKETIEYYHFLVPILAIWSLIILPFLLDELDSRRVIHWMLSVVGAPRRRLREFAHSHGLKVKGSQVVGVIEGRHISVDAEPGSHTIFTAELATQIQYRLKFFCELEIEPDDLLVAAQANSYWTGTSEPFVKLLKEDDEVRILFSELTRDFREIELSPTRITASGHFADAHEFDHGLQLIDDFARALESRAKS